jgi:Ca2+-transporting ATPase
LNFVKKLWWANYKEMRDATVVQMITFSSERKAMGAVVKTAHGYHSYVKGASEILTKLCSSYVVVEQHGSSRPSTESDDVDVADINGDSVRDTVNICHIDSPTQLILVLLLGP